MYGHNHNDCYRLKTDGWWDRIGCNDVGNKVVCPGGDKNITLNTLQGIFSEPKPRCSYVPGMSPNSVWKCGNRYYTITQESTYVYRYDDHVHHCNVLGLKALMWDNRQKWMDLNFVINKR